jgi:HEAT repeat protein
MGGSADKYIQDLKNNNFSIRVNAARELGFLNNTRAVEPLILTLKNDKIPDVRATAAASLGNFGDERAVEPLIQAINDQNSLVRNVAIESLGVLGDKRAVEPLIQALKSDNDYVATTSLGKLKDPRAVEPLIKMVEANHAGVQSHLITTDDAGKERFWHFKNRAIVGADALEEIGDPRAVDVLLKVLQESSQPPILCSVADALAKIDDPRAVEPLVRTYERVADFYIPSMLEIDECIRKSLEKLPTA